MDLGDQAVDPSGSFQRFSRSVRVISGARAPALTVEKGYFDFS
jgi:hypothetical protein